MANSSCASGPCVTGPPPPSPPVRGGGRTQFKMVVLGDSGVGKTNIVKRFCEAHRIKDGDGDITLQIWDTAGQERFASLVPLYYRGAHAAILVYDITDRASFERAKKWKDELMRHGEVDVMISLVGNKLDLARQRQVSTQEGQVYAADEKLQFYECSAKTNHPAVDRVFSEMAIALRKRARTLPPRPYPPPAMSLRSTGKSKAATDDDTTSCCTIL